MRESILDFRLRGRFWSAGPLLDCFPKIPSPAKVGEGEGEGNPMYKKITRRAFCSMLLALPFSARAQTGKILRIGVLDNTTASGSAVRLQAFWQEIRRLGWIEGKNITIERRFAEGKSGRLPELVADLVRLKVDLIVVTTTASALAAKRATTTIPIVMTGSADPVGAGLIANLARPGSNVTGVSNLSVDLNTKRLEVLKDAVPKLDRVGLPLTPGSNTSIARDLQMKELRPAAVALKLKLEEIETQPDAKGLENFFKTAKQKQVGAIMMGPGPIYFTERKRIVELAVKYRLPAIYPQKEYVDEGGLMYYGIDSADLYRRAAVHVDKILRGAKPADLPVEQAMRFEFIISLKAAKQIGLTLSPAFLSRANKVIQ
jgi:putative ABC transport system substrate-binding protein